MSILGYLGKKWNLRTGHFLVTEMTSHSGPSARSPRGNRL